MNSLIKGYALRRAVAGALAIFVAVIANHYVSFSHEGWLVLAAFAACQTTRGTPLRQSLFYVFMIILLAVFLPASSAGLVQARVQDAVIGGVLGILFGQLVLPVSIHQEFCQGVLPVLRALSRDLNALCESYIQQSGYGEPLFQQQSQVEMALQMKGGMYPEWVYEVGFNRGLRAGFRFFLVNIERLAEVVFSLNYFISRSMDVELVRAAQDDVKRVMEKNDELLQVLIHYFSNQRWHEIDSHSDFTSDMLALEKTLNRVVPNTMDLLDISPDYMIFTAMVRDLKDIRGLLLQLVMALPPVLVETKTAKH